MVAFVFSNQQRFKSVYQVKLNLSRWFVGVYVSKVALSRRRVEWLA